MIRQALAVLVFAVATARAQAPIVVRDAGPGLPGRLVQSILAQPHTVVGAGDDTVSLPIVASDYQTTVIVFARRVTVASDVHGDVIVIGGDLFVHPGARITGRAIAIGGTAYPSAFGIVGGRFISYPDETFDVARSAAAVSLSYRRLDVEYPAEPITFPGIFGFRVPTYDRTNGLSVPFAPLLATDSARLQLEPRVTYRSQLGVWDPSLDGTYQLNRRASFLVSAGRGSFTNDGWIKSDLVNSLTAITSGEDVRNWYRADRGSASLQQKWEGLDGSIEPYLGFAVERAWTARPDSAPTSGPWSMFGRTSDQGMFRPNPPVTPGTISSIETGAHADWSDDGVVAKLSANVEIAVHAPGGLDDAGDAPSDTHFTQGTLDGSVAFPTFGSEQYVLQVHAVGTSGAAPPQRWAYLGGSGTLGTLDLLQLGGDQLLLIDSRYEFPVTGISIPIVGSPVISLRHILGSAGVGHLPALTQIIGVRLALTPVETEVLMDTSKRKLVGSVGFSFVR